MPNARDARLAGQPAGMDPARPQLTQLVDPAPGGPDWLHEIKFDGYRMQARLDRGAVRLLTRTGLDWTHKYPAIADAVASIGARQAYLDGELCGVRPDGVTSFSMIHACSPAAPRSARTCKASTWACPCPAEREEPKQASRTRACSDGTAMVVNGWGPGAENADHGKNSKAERLLEEHRASERGYRSR
jgi:hypothetical protein